MNLKQKSLQTILAFALAIALLTSFAPIERPAEAAGAAPDAGLVTVSQVIDPAAVRPGPGSVPSSSVQSGASSESAAQPSATPTGLPPSALPATSRPGGKFEPETMANGKRARAGSLIVKFRAGAQASAQHDAHQQVGSQAVEPIGHGQAVRVQVEPGTLAQALSAYAARSDVERVEPDYLLYADMTPNDPRYGEEWALPMIAAPAAWDRVGGASGVRVAVLDTGIASHPDLVGRVILAQDFTGSPYGTTDRHGHGTHVAGTVAANANNGAKVISMSLGANLDCPGIIGDAVTYAWTRGAVIVAAAGNDGMNDVHTPANCTHAVPVGAVSSSDARSNFSNYGLSVPIAAPGESILSTSNTGSYVFLSGTSMATPHAAGVAALIWASSYGTSNQAVVNRLFSTADRIAGTGSLWGYGRINAAAAVAGSADGQTPSPAPSPSPSPAPSPSPSPAPLPPVSCTPRPPVRVTTVKSPPGTLQVTVTVGTASAGPNRLQQIRFGAGTNATIQAGTQAEAGNFTVTLPAESVSFTFTISRNVTGAATTVPLTVIDRCGEWNTLVGGGPAAF